MAAGRLAVDELTTAPAGSSASPPAAADSPGVPPVVPVLLSVLAGYFDTFLAMKDMKEENHDDGQTRLLDDPACWCDSLVDFHTRQRRKPNSAEGP